ncbi:MAG: hypothetical protein QOF10_3046, partial [Kribbellaceae bacterium]|nr:hypothetical protein [Kribbellaceae bacterium]
SEDPERADCTRDLSVRTPPGGLPGQAVSFVHEDESVEQLTRFATEVIPAARVAFAASQAVMIRPPR